MLQYGRQWGDSDMGPFTWHIYTSMLYSPEHLVHFQLGRKVLVHQLQCFPDFVVHRDEQIGAELIEQSRQQNEQPVVQIVGVRQNQFVDRVEEQRVDFGVRIDEHFAEQIQNGAELLVGQFVAVGQIVRQAGETLLAFGPMRRRAVVYDGDDVDRCPNAVQFASGSVPRAGLFGWKVCRYVDPKS